MDIDGKYLPLGTNQLGGPLEIRSRTAPIVHDSLVFFNTELVENRPWRPEPVSDDKEQAHHPESNV
jgi:hypothetical protein